MSENENSLIRNLRDVDLKERVGHLKDNVVNLKNNVVHFIGTMKDSVAAYNDNRFIHTGYRINYNTPYLMLKSLFHKHNELINVWTHIVGALLAIVMIVQIILFLDSPRQRVEQDIDLIFTIQHEQYSDQPVDPSILQELFTKIETIEKSLITSETYKEVVAVISVAADQLQYQALQEYSQTVNDKLGGLKDKIITSIDSEEFDWVEIYKHHYEHTKIIRQEQKFRSYQDPQHVSRWPIVVFLVSAITCMTGSAMFHLFYQMGERANRYLMRVDYGGISLLILGSTFPPFYYGFYCDAMLRYFYLITVGTACLVAYVISVFDFIHQEEWRRVKGLMYGSLGLFAGVPSIHLYIRELTKPIDSDYLPFQGTFIYYLLMGTSYLGGLAIYTSRIPERFLPGKFDIIGNSHNIWHVCVFLGVAFSYLGALDNLNDRKFQFCKL